MNKQIAEEESKIANLNKYLKSEKWERDQNYFSKTCYELSEKYLPENCSSMLNLRFCNLFIYKL